MSGLLPAEKQVQGRPARLESRCRSAKHQAELGLITPPPQPPTPTPQPPPHPPQDVIQFGPLLQTMAQQVVQDPLFVPALLQHVGIEAMLDWLRHVAALGLYSSLHAGLAPQLRKLAPGLQPMQRYRLNRLLEALEYGSGADYKL